MFRIIETDPSISLFEKSGMKEVCTTSPLKDSRA
jgi:hypothetical protein